MEWGRRFAFGVAVRVCLLVPLAGGGCSGGGSSSGGDAGSSGDATFEVGDHDATAADAADDGSGADASGAMTADEFCDALADAMCDWMVRCFALTDRSSCPTAGPAGFVLPACARAAAAVDAGRMTFDGDRAGACLDEHRLPYCGGPPPVVQATFTAGHPCSGLFHGAVPNGQDCYDAAFFGGDCADGYCARDVDACPGTCSPFADDSAACGAAGQAPCDPESSCQAGLCEPRRTQGQPCDGDHPCRTDLQCVADVPADGQSTCRTVGGIGAACESLADCRAPLVCQDGQCALTGTAGVACRDNSNCPEETRCLIEVGTTDATCRAPARADQACATAQGDQCEDGLVCLPDSQDSPTGTCTPLGRAGDPCAPIGCATGLWCRYDEAGSDGTCTQIGQTGDGCTDAFGAEQAACASGLFCLPNGTCQPPGSAPNDPCDPFNSPTCGTGLWCTEAGTCQLLGAAHDACAPGQPSCQAGLTCFPDGTCQPPGGQDEPCVSGESATCQEGLWCQQGSDVCQPPAAESALCNQAFASTTCAQGLYCACLNSETGCVFGSDEPDPNQVCVAQSAAGQPCSGAEACLSGFCDLSRAQPVCATLCNPP